MMYTDPWTPGDLRQWYAVGVEQHGPRWVVVLEPSDGHGSPIYVPCASREAAETTYRICDGVPVVDVREVS